MWLKASSLVKGVLCGTTEGGEIMFKGHSGLARLLEICLQGLRLCASFSLLLLAGSWLLEKRLGATMWRGWQKALMGCKGYEALYTLSVGTTARWSSFWACQVVFTRPKFVGGPVCQDQKRSTKENRRMQICYFTVIALLGRLNNNNVYILQGI